MSRTATQSTSIPNKHFTVLGTEPGHDTAGVEEADSTEPPILRIAGPRSAPPYGYGHPLPVPVVSQRLVDRAVKMIRVGGVPDDVDCLPRTAGEPSHGRTRADEP